MESQYVTSGQSPAAASSAAAQAASATATGSRKKERKKAPEKKHNGPVHQTVVDDEQAKEQLKVLLVLLSDYKFDSQRCAVCIIPEFKHDALHKSVNSLFQCADDVSGQQSRIWSTHALPALPGCVGLQLGTSQYAISSMRSRDATSFTLIGVHSMLLQARYSVDQAHGYNTAKSVGEQ